MPQHKHPHPHPHHHPAGGAEWIVVVDDDNLLRSEYADLLVAIGEALRTGSAVEINGTVVRVPGSVAFELKFERTPHGSHALVIRSEWVEEGAGVSSRSTARGLVIRAATSVSDD